jgi:hypothetical protein
MRMLGNLYYAVRRSRPPNPHFAVDRGLVAGHKFLHNDDARHEALPQAGRFSSTCPRLSNFRVNSRHTPHARFADLPLTDRPDLVRLAGDSEINSNLSRPGRPLNCAELITRT